MPLEIPQTAMDILRHFNSDDAAAKEAYGLTPEEDSPQAAPWPDPLRPEAFHGVAGELVRKIEPHSEADPAALLTHVLVSFGNAVGRGPHFRVGGAEHHANLYCVNVGATASRKGTAKEDVLFVIRQVVPDWFDNRIQSGLSSGEGFIWAVRDPIEEQQPIRDKGRVVDYQNVVTDPGVGDKRLLVIEPEFGSTLRVLEREGNTLSAQLRQAWDSGNLRILTKNKAAKATGAHISLLAHITREELLKYLNQTEQANGYANRHLWVCVRRSKFLPDGGNLHALDLSGITAQLRDAVQFARTVCEVRRSEAARAIWHAVYPALAGDRTGLFGAITARAEAQVMRLALEYALMDKSFLIEPEHLKAALAVWQYCEDSARFIFGAALGDPTADKILVALRRRPDGMTQTDLIHHFGRNKSSTEIGRALKRLAELGRIKVETEAQDGPGRPAQRWRAL